MLRTIALLAGTSALLFMAAGCGTIANLEGGAESWYGIRPGTIEIDPEARAPTTPFGGLERDSRQLARVWAEETKPHSGPNPFPILLFLERSLVISSNLA